jgi:hypothetical protein
MMTWRHPLPGADMKCICAESNACVKICRSIRGGAAVVKLPPLCRGVGEAGGRAGTA